MDLFRNHFYVCLHMTNFKENVSVDGDASFLNETINPLYSKTSKPSIDLNQLIELFQSNQTAKLLYNLTKLQNLLQNNTQKLYSDDEILNLFSIFTQNIHKVAINVLHKSILVLISLLPQISKESFQKLSESSFITEISSFYEHAKEPFFKSSLILISIFLENGVGFDTFMISFNLDILIAIAETDQSGLEVYTLFKALTLYLPNDFISNSFKKCLIAYDLHKMPPYILTLIENFAECKNFMDDEVFGILMFYFEKDVSDLMMASLQVLFHLIDINFDAFRPLFDTFKNKIKDRRVTDDKLAVCYQILTKLIIGIGYDIDVYALVEILNEISNQIQKNSTILSKALLFCAKSIFDIAPAVTIEDFINHNSFIPIFPNIESQDTELIEVVLQIMLKLINVSKMIPNKAVFEEINENYIDNIQELLDSDDESISNLASNILEYFKPDES